LAQLDAHSSVNGISALGLFPSLLAGIWSLGFSPYNLLWNNW